MPYKQHREQKRMIINEDPDDQALADTIDNWVQDTESWVQTWESNQVKWHKLRMRIKKTKTFPFPGCSNLRMPTIDTKLKKLKSAIMNVLIGIRPIVQAIPQPSGNWETARKVEKYIDHLVMDIIQIKPKLTIIVDQSLEKGFYLAKPFYRREVTTRIEELSLEDISLDEALWLFDPVRSLEEIHAAIAQKLQIDSHPWVLKENIAEVERVTEEILSGKQSVKFKLRDMLYNAPDVSLRPPERIYVPTTTGFDPNKHPTLLMSSFCP